MDDLQIAWRPLGELIPYARNPRTHTDAQVAQIAASIREFGWTNPVLVDGASGIIAGHGRVLAARKLGLDRVPVIELAHMSEAQKRAYVLADNQLALNAGWDEALLRLELADLSELGFDLGLIGFGAGELERLLAGEGRTGLTEDDEAPALPEQAVTRPGDLWLLGEHRLLCGDATVLADVERVLDGSARRHDLHRSALQRGLCQLPEGQAARQAPPDPERRPRLRLRGVPLRRLHQHPLGHQRRLLHLHEQLGAAHAAAGIRGGRRQMVDLRHLGQEHLHPRPGRLPASVRADPLWLDGEGSDHYWCGARDQGDVWFIDKPVRNDLHPTMKPVALVERAIRNSSKSRDIVLDPFGGSGSTLIACEKAGPSGAAG